MEDEENMNAKVVIIGDTKVGKTSILHRLTENDFQDGTMATIGSCLTEMTYTIDNEQIDLKIWDTAGQEQFKSMVALYYRDASICILTYSIDNSDSFQSLSNWYNDVIESASVAPKFIVAGNKSDLEEDRQVTNEEADIFATRISAMLFKVSAKTGEGISELFQYAARLAYESKTQARCQVRVIDPKPPNTCVC